MTHRLTLSRGYTHVPGTRLLWRALTGSFFNTLAELEPRISRDH